MTSRSRLPHEYLRASRVIKALHDHWQDQKGQNTEAPWWCHTELLNLLVPDELTIIGETAESRTTTSGRRKEHLVPRLAVAEQCFRMYDDHKSVEDVALFLQEWLKIVLVSTREASLIDSRDLKQKQNMLDGEWWRSPDSLYSRLERAGITNYQVRDLP